MSATMTTAAIATIATVDAARITRALLSDEPAGETDRSPRPALDRKIEPPEASLRKESRAAVFQGRAALAAQGEGKATRLSSPLPG